MNKNIVICLFICFLASVVATIIFFFRFTDEAPAWVQNLFCAAVWFYAAKTFFKMVGIGIKLGYKKRDTNKKPWGL